MGVVTAQIAKKSSVMGKEQGLEADRNIPLMV